MVSNKFISNNKTLEETIRENYFHRNNEEKTSNAKYNKIKGSQTHQRCLQKKTKELKH